MAALENLCKFHHFGHCKFGSHCKKQHIINTCTKFPCKAEGCLMRHPRLCRFFSQFARCKFGDQCSYFHKTVSEASNRHLESEIEKLKEEIKNLKIHCQVLQREIHIVNSTKDPLESHQEQDSIQTSIPCNNCDFYCENEDALNHHI